MIFSRELFISVKRSLCQCWFCWYVHRV